MPDLAQWKERVLALTPGADVDAMEANLWRVSPPYNLRRSLAIRTLAERLGRHAGPVLADNFDEYERWTPRFDHWWAFVVDPVTPSSRGQRARGVRGGALRPRDQEGADRASRGSPRLGGANVTVVPTATQASTWYLFRAADHLRDSGARAPTSPTRCPGRPTGSSGCAAAPRSLSFGVTTKVGPDGDRTRRTTRPCTTSTSLAPSSPSSPAQRKAMRRPLRSAVAPNIWVTGSPRTDLLLCPEESLAADLRAQLLTLRRATRGPPARRLGAGAPARRAIAARPRGRRPGVAASLGRAARRRGRRAPPVAGPVDDARPGSGGASGPRACSCSRVASFSRRRDAAARGRCPGVRLHQRAARLPRALAGPSLAFAPDLDEVAGGSRAPPRPRRRGGRAGLSRPVRAVRAAWENCWPSPTAEQVAERAQRAGPCCTPTGTGGAALRVVRRVQATYLPIGDGWPPNL